VEKDNQAQTLRQILLHSDSNASLQVAFAQHVGVVEKCTGLTRSHMACVIKSGSLVAVVNTHASARFRKERWTAIIDDS
jgi:hypothetical protein